MVTTAIDASALVLEIAERLRDPEQVKAQVLDPKNANPSPTSPPAPSWHDLALSGGYPGILLLFSALERCGWATSEDEAAAHRYVLKIKEALETQGLYGLSLYGGASGICFALAQASHSGTRYQKMLQTLHSFLLERVEKTYLAPLGHRPTTAGLYDPIQGISGIGRYALENVSSPPFLDLAEKCAKTLVALSEPFEVAGQKVAGWYLPPTDPLNARHQALCPKGTFNLGLAHGVTGILAFLAIATLRGVTVEGQREAMQRMAEWIRSKSFVEAGAIHWPYSISWEEEVEGAPRNYRRSKDAWCYGVAGIARTLFLAGRALDDAPLKAFALEAFCGIFRRSQEEWQLPGPALCHGIAGLLLITYEMAKEAGGDETLAARADSLQELLLNFYSPETPFGFVDMEPCREGGFAQVSKAGFLEGSAGIGLALLAPFDPAPHSHLPLLIHA